MSQPEQLRQQIQHCLAKDQHHLYRELEKIEARIRNKQPVDQLQAKLESKLHKSGTKVAQRQALIPAISYPEQLPIAARREEIKEAIASHQVVILAGETGSGKTTQLPKICLELGRGTRGLIGHTQPRRIAARTVASRIAEEINTPLGELVGYQVRFSDHSNERTLVKLMTDGILLAEIQHDRYLTKYDTLIIDEAHERSLNIDFLLGYLKQILPKRPDLKVIITSATIDLERFASHFADARGKPAPIIEVSGRTYPVEVIYSPPLADELPRQIVDAIDEVLTLERERSVEQRGGDILVFMSGEREIRETALAIRKAQFRDLDVLPLYARLSLAEQNKVFNGHKGRRVVLATNVAETSITVPGIRYVIDPGTARISRYSYRTKIQRLPIERVSQASANQRMGRCGRVAEGVCIRLYDEQDFASRPAFTEAEILRTNLAAVILQMLQLRIGDIRDFPFVDAPDNRLIKDGFKLLQELKAVNSKGQLSQSGRELSRLPVDPRLGRMLQAAKQLHCLREMLIIVAALSAQDPRERPADKQQAADEKHRAYKDEHSDFIAFLNLWQVAEEQRQELSQNQFRKYCQKHFLSYMRLREWREIQHQLHVSCNDLGWKLNREAADYEAIHRALLHGLSGNIGQQEEKKEFLGARNRRFQVFPGSSQYKKPPKWLVCAELLETSQLFAHTVAKIEPQWVLDAVEHLLKRSHSEPHYSARNGQVMAFEKITLHGLTLVEKLRVSYGQINPALSSDIFVREALVEGKYAANRKAKGKFFAANQKLIAELEDFEAKSRKRDILVDEEAIYGFYRQRVPVDIVNLAGFEHWRKEAEQEQPRLLYLERDYLMQRDTSHVGEAQFPDQITWDGLTLPLSYHFEPGTCEDGVTATVPLQILHQLPEHWADWLVPGLLREKCIALVKALPKNQRRHFVPVPDFVDRALPALKPANVPLTEALAEQLGRLIGQPFSADNWDKPELDDYYRMNFKLVDEQGKQLAMGRDLLQLKQDYKDRIQATLQSSAGQDFERDTITAWDFGELPRQVQYQQSGVEVTAWPALVDEGDSVAIRLYDNPREALAVSQRGVCRLALLSLGQTAKYLRKELLRGKDMGLSVATMGKRDAVVDDLLLFVARELLQVAENLPRQQQGFESLLVSVKERWVSEAQEAEQRLIKILEGLVAIKAALKAKKNNLALALAVGDIQQQLSQLFYPGCLYQTPAQWFGHIPRFLKAIEQRIEKAALQAQKDRVLMAELAPLQEQLQQWIVGQGPWWRELHPDKLEYRWLLEELRVSFFAQSLKTSVPVSTKRLNKLWQGA